MKPRNLLIVLLALLLAVGLAYMLQGVVRSTVIEPLLYFLTIGSVLYDALPQAVWWGLFILVGVLLAWRSLSRKRRAAIPAPLEGTRLSRARTWTQLIHRSAYGDYSRWLFARQAADLAVNIIAHQERVALSEARQRLASGRVRLPPEVQDYLRTGLDAPSFRHYAELAQSLRYRYWGRSSPLDLDPAQIVEVLEDQMKRGGYL